MAVAPLFNFVDVQDTTTINASLWRTLQNNIVTYTSNYMPIIGGVFSGPVVFSTGQTFPSSQVAISNPTYSHSGFWRTLADHINDSSVHRVAGLPLAHASTHELSGSDMLYGDQVSISANTPTTSIKSYVDTSITTAVANSTSSFAPASTYEIGGSMPLYGSLLPITSATPTVDIKSYVDNSVSSAISGGVPANATFTTITLNGTSSNITFSAAGANLTAQGASVLTTDGTNLSLATKGPAGQINFGNQTTNNLFGNISTAGYSIGTGTIIGPTSSVFVGNVTFNNDIVVNRSAAGNAVGGSILFGNSTPSALINYSVNVLNSFYLSNPVSINGNLTFYAGNSISIPNNINLGGIVFTSGSASLTTDTTGTLLYLDTKETGQINLGYNNTSLSSIKFGPTGTWGNLDSTGLLVATSKIGTLATTINGTLAVNGAKVNSAGDIGLSRSSTSGMIWFGQGVTAASFDYGVNSSNQFSFSSPTSVLSQIASNGSYLVGSSSYGSTSATINGSVTANRAIYAQTGTSYAGGSGYTFTGNSTGDTGMFSSGPGDLRFITTSTPALAFTSGGTIANFAGAINTPGLITTSTLIVQSTATFSSNLQLTGSLLAGNTTVTKFRVKNQLSLGYVSGTIATSAVYPNVVVPSYVLGQIENIRISVVTADTGSTQTTFNIYKNGTVIGQISLANGATASSNYPTTNPTLVLAGDQLHATCTAAGGATGVSVSLEMSQVLY